MSLDFSPFLCHGRRFSLTREKPKLPSRGAKPTGDADLGGRPRDRLLLADQRPTLAPSPGDVRESGA